MTDNREPVQNQNVNKRGKMAFRSQGCPSWVLQNVPVIIDAVLSPLPMRSLNACARVCRTWNDIVKKIKQNRHHIKWTFLDCKEEEECDEMIVKLKSFIQNIFSQPEYFLTFCSTNLYERPVKLPSSHSSRFPRSAKCKQMEIGDFLKSVLPKSCNMMGISADGVVGTSNDLKLQREIEGGLSLSCLSLPQIDGLEIYTFYIDIYKYANRTDEPSPTFHVEQVSTIPEGKEVKAILFFCDEPFCPPEIGYTLLQHYKDTVIAGGYVDNLISPPMCSQDSTGEVQASLMCVGICGKRVHVSSVVIKEDVNSAEEVDKLIGQLKTCNLPEKCSFAFMFACIGRGVGHYGEQNVESKVFHKHFPQTPLFGFFGNGEVGFRYLRPFCQDSDISSKQTDKTAPKPLPKLYHAYTTIICLVSVV